MTPLGNSTPNWLANGWNWLQRGCCTRSLVIPLVTSGLLWLPIVSMEDVNLSAKTCKIMTELLRNFRKCNKQEIENTRLQSKSGTSPLQPTHFKGLKNTVAFQLGSKTFSVYTLPWALRFTLALLAESVCTQVGIFHANHGQPRQSASDQSNCEQVLGTTPINKPQHSTIVYSAFCRIHTAS